MTRVDPDSIRPQHPDYTGQTTEPPVHKAPSTHLGTNHSTIQSSEEIIEQGYLQDVGNPSLQPLDQKEVTYSEVRSIFRELLETIKPSRFNPPLTVEELQALILGYNNPRFNLPPELRARMDELKKNIDGAKASLWDQFPSAQGKYGEAIENIDLFQLMMVIAGEQFLDSIKSYSERIDILINSENVLPSDKEGRIALIDVLSKISQAIEMLEEMLRETKLEDFKKNREMVEAILIEIASLDVGQNLEKLMALKLTITRIGEELQKVMEGLDKFFQFQEIFSNIQNPEEFKTSLNAFVEEVWTDFLETERIQLSHLFLFSEMTALVNQSQWRDQLIGTIDLDDLMTNLEQGVPILQDWTQGNLALGDEDEDVAELQKLLKMLKKLFSMMMLLGMGNSVPDIASAVKDVTNILDAQELIHHPMTPG